MAAVKRLYVARTELAGHPDAERFAAVARARLTELGLVSGPRSRRAPTAPVVAPVAPVVAVPGPTAPARMARRERNAELAAAMRAEGMEPRGRAWELARDGVALADIRAELAAAEVSA
jgi:hypothetical protein